jgi:hypothetical protein
MKYFFLIAFIIVSIVTGCKNDEQVNSIGSGNVTITIVFRRGTTINGGCTTEYLGGADIKWGSNDYQLDNNSSVDIHVASGTIISASYYSYTHCTTGASSGETYKQEMVAQSNYTWNI